jgi:hypothetical protein
MSEKEREVTKDEVKALINDAWRQIGPGLSEHRGMRKIETVDGIVFQFTSNGRAGPLHSLYEPEPIVRALLKNQDYQSTLTWLMCFLVELSTAVGLSVENAIDTANNKTMEFVGDVEAVMNRGTTSISEKSLREIKKATLGKLDQRSRILVKPDPPGSAAKVKLSRIEMAIEKLGADRKAINQITPEKIAEVLGSSPSAIYKSLERRGISFQQLLKNYSDSTIKRLIVEKK